MVDQVGRPKKFVRNPSRINDTIHCIINDKVGNYQIFCWIDNNIVKMVSNIYTGASSDEHVLRNRRKP